MSATVCHHPVTVDAVRTRQAASCVCAQPGIRPSPMEPAARMWMSAPKAQACVAVGCVRTCLATSAVFALLASGAHPVRRMWTSVPRSHHHAGQAAATIPLALFTVLALLASAPEGPVPPAKMWMSVPGAPNPVPMDNVRTQRAASGVCAPLASDRMWLALRVRMWMSVRTTWRVRSKNVSTHLAHSSAGPVLLATTCSEAAALMWMNVVRVPPAVLMATARTPKAPSAALVLRVTGLLWVSLGPAQT